MSRFFSIARQVALNAWVISLVAASAWSAPSKSTPSPTPSSTPSGSVPISDLSDDTNSQLKKAVVDSQKTLGVLDPAHKKVFDEEIVPQFALFIKDYHQQGNMVQAQVDTNAIKNYLGFSATKDLALGTPQFLLFMRVDTRCPKCTEAAPAIRKMMQSRAESHGFQPIWITPEELLDSKPSELAEKRNASGAMEMTLKPAPMDDVDSAHADEKKFLNLFSFDVRGVAHYEDQSELFDTDSFEQASAKMLTQAYVELGVKAGMNGNNALKQEMQISANNIVDFNQYNDLKNQLQAKLKDIAMVEERKISRGHAVFAVKTNHSLDEIKQLIAGLGNLQVEMR